MSIDKRLKKVSSIAVAVLMLMVVALTVMGCSKAGEVGNLEDKENVTGEIYNDDKLPQPEENIASQMGGFLDYQDTVVQEGGRDKYLIRAWEYKKVLNTFVKEYGSYRLLPQDTRTMSFVHSSTTIDATWGELVKVGLLSAAMRSVDNGFGLGVLKIGTTNNATLRAAFNKQFGYEKKHTDALPDGISTAATITETNQSDRTLHYAWQSRVIMIVYYVQVFELLYDDSTYLHKVRLVEVGNQFKLEGAGGLRLAFSLALRQYYYDDGSGKFLICDKNGTLNTDFERYV